MVVIGFTSANELNSHRSAEFVQDYIDVLLVFSLLMFHLCGFAT
jgi:hypothetical protein